MTHKNRHAVIEIGSRSTSLLVGELSDRKLEVLISKGSLAGLGTNQEHNKANVRQMFKRTLRKIEEYISISEKFKAETIKIVGTEALRNAKDQQELCKASRDYFGIPVKVLSKKEEAYFSLLAAIKGLGCQINPIKGIFLLDQGGGSMELAVGRYKKERTKLIDSKSYSLGTHILTDKFNEVDKNWQAFEKKISTQVKKLPELKGVEDTLYTVGLGSAITSLAWSKVSEDSSSQYDSRKVHGEMLSSEIIQTSIGTLKSKEEITNAAGLIAFFHFMKKYNRSEIIVSGQGLRYGILWAEVDKT